MAYPSLTQAKQPRQPPLHSVAGGRTSPAPPLPATPAATTPDPQRDYGNGAVLLQVAPDSVPPRGGAARPPALSPASTNHKEPEHEDLGIIPFFQEAYRGIRLQPKPPPEASAAFYSWALGLPWAIGGFGGHGDWTQWPEYAKFLQSLTPGGSEILDPLSVILGRSMDRYLASELFTPHLKRNIPSLLASVAILQSGYSTFQALHTPSESPGAMVAEPWSRHAALVVTLINAALSKYLTPPSLGLEPLSADTHSLYRRKTLLEGGMPLPGLILKQSRGMGEGQGGSRIQAGLSLNLAKIFGGDDPETLNGYEAAASFNLDRLEPSKDMGEKEGQRPRETREGGLILGHGANTFGLSVGTRLDPAAANAMTAFLVKGGFVRRSSTGLFRRISVDASFIDVKKNDVLAPGMGTSSPEAVQAGQVAPSVSVAIGDQKKLSLDAGASFITSSLERFNISGANIGVAYTYMGDHSRDQLPLVRMEVAISVSRLDFYDPRSPILTGLRFKALIDRFFAGFQLMLGADNVSALRAAQNAVSSTKDMPIVIGFNLGFMWGGKKNK